MNALDDRLYESRPALPKYVASLRRAAVQFAADAGADDLQQENIALAMSEAISNSVIHAYPENGNPGNVSVSAWQERGQIVVMVCDDGCGMSRGSETPGLGLGLPLIERVAERVEIDDDPVDPGVRLRMTFPLRGR